MSGPKFGRIFEAVEAGEIGTPAGQQLSEIQAACNRIHTNACRRQL